jgi:hypothetical protein
MPRYEYKVVPAPKKGLKGKDVKGAEARFSHALEELMNSLSGEGWEYQRAETLPSTERAGLTGTKNEWRNVLVFRRPHASDVDAFQPELLPAPQDEAPVQDKAEAKATPQNSDADGGDSEKADDVKKTAAPTPTSAPAKKD